MFPPSGGDGVLRRQLLSVILFVVISVVRVSNFGLCGQTCLVTLVRAPLSYAGGASIKQREIIGNFSIVIHCSQDSSQPLFVLGGARSLRR